MKIKMATPGSPALELKDRGAFSTVKPQEKTVFTFVCSKLCRLLQCTPVPILLEEGGGPPPFCPLQRPWLMSCQLIMPRLVFHGNPS